VIEADLSTIAAVAAEADKVLHVVDGPLTYLVHLEFQTTWKADLPRRVQWYNTLISYRHSLPVRSVAVLLRDDPKSPNVDGRFEEAFPGEEAYLQFHYRV